MLVLCLSTPTLPLTSGTHPALQPLCLSKQHPFLCGMFLTSINIVENSARTKKIKDYLENCVLDIILHIYY
jgi:hypothetical protein